LTYLEFRVVFHERRETAQILWRLSVIDQLCEQVFPWEEIPREAAPGRRPGTKIHRLTMIKWATTGVYDIRLETVVIGGRRCTSLEALQRFYAAVTAEKNARGDKARQPKPRTRRRALAAARAATVELDAKGA
jgi:hypothetical protein